MSGIFGIINFDGQPVNRADLERMSKSMAHRGPDGCNIRVKNNVGLGHLMLCSTKESLSENLPWEDSETGLLITADARLDNRDDLITALSISSRSGSPITDSYLILTAFKKWGRACVDHLLGDFSFAVWDRGNRRLFFARDHMGLRPFYYYSCDKFFVFASAAKAVIQATRVPDKINEGRIADFLVAAPEGVNNTSTFFTNVYRMPPAHFGIVEKKKISFHHYWNPDTTSCLRLSSDNDYTDALEETLTLSVKARTRSQYPAASMLSGGVDSSVICGIANSLNQKNGTGPFRVYSAVSDDVSSCCESRFINLMIDHGGLDPIRVNPSEVKNHVADFDRISKILEDPFDESWVMLQMIYLSARKHNNVVVLDGVDGDLIAGLTTSYPSYLLRKGRVKNALHEIGRLRTNYFGGRPGWLKTYTQAIRPVVTPNSLRHLKASIWPNSWAKASIRNSMLSKQFMRKIKLEERLEEYLSHSTVGFCPSLKHAHAESIVAPFLTAAIERYNRIASYCGVEARQPFHDKRVVEFCLSLPWQQKAQHGWMKYCLRNVLERVAPAEVAWRSEFDSIMWKFGSTWNEVNQKKNISTIAKNREQLLGFLDQKQLDQMLNRYAKGDQTTHESIWNVVTLAKWLQKNHATT